MDRIVEKLDEIGKPAWIGLMVLSFVLFWPIGLALLAFLIWSGRMGHKRHRSCAGRWRFEPRGNAAFKSDTSGNRAFDEYREETLKRLEQEQAEFFEFLERLRFAKDKSEFDQFLSERRQGAEPMQPQPEA